MISAAAVRLVLQSTVLGAAIVLASMPTKTLAATKNWNIASGNWSAAGARSPSGVPGAGDIVNITGFISGNIAINYDYAGPDVGLNTLTLDAIHTVGVTLTMTMPGGNLITTNEYIANGGAGQTQSTIATLDVAGGVNTISNNLYVGYNASDQGTYLLRGSAQIFATTGTQQSIGYSGTGTFTQGGTSVNHTQTLTLGALAGSLGTYNLGPNLLDTSSLLVTNEFIGSAGTAGFTQTHGTNTVSAGGVFDVAELATSTGVYALNGGALSAPTQLIGVSGNGTLNQSGSSTNTLQFLTLGVFANSTGTYRLGGTASLSLTTGQEVIGNSGTGSFLQTGGSNGLGTHPLYVGENSNGNGTYSLSVGTVSAGNEYVGDSGIGAFSQTSGTNTIATGSALYVGNNSGALGSYSLSGTGSLTVNGNEFVGNSSAGNGITTGGTFTQTGGAHSISGAGHVLYIGNNAGATGTYNLSGGVTSTLTLASDEYIGFNGAGTFNQSGGEHILSNTASALNLGFSSGAAGTYNLSGITDPEELVNILAVNGDENIGYNGRGVFNQSGGEHDATSPGTGTLYVGRNVGSTGTYNLSGNGLLFVPNNEVIGNAGSGTFNQTGGEHHLNNLGALFLGNTAGGVGNYTLSSGILEVNSASEYVGKAGTGHFTQMGGTNATHGGADSIVYVGSDAGSVGTYDLSGGNLQPRGLVVGASGTGTFTQTGGTVTVDNGFGAVQLATHNGSNGTYNLSGTGIVAAGDVTVGAVGGVTSTAHFNQIGGSAMFDALQIEGAGIYNLSGGSLVCATATVDSGHAMAFNIGGTATLTVQGLLQDFNLSTFNNTINFTGGTINAGGLDLRHAVGSPSAFGWTGGTLNITSDVTWDPGDTSNTTSSAFGSALALGVNQTLQTTGNETLGLADRTLALPFLLTLNAGSTHAATSNITLNPTGTLTRNAGSTLTYGDTFHMNGGTFNGTLDNSNSFQYTSGTFSGRLVNHGAVSITNNFAPTNGVENDALITLSIGQTLTPGGAGLDNQGTFTLSGGVLVGGGPLSNSGYFIINAGSITANNGLTNQSGGQFVVNQNAAASADGAVSNVGEMQLGGLAATIGGSGTLSNTGLIRGDGIISKSVSNNAGGELRAESGKRLKFTGAVSANAGRINLLGGIAEFSNPLTNGATGQIIGSGTLKVGSTGLTNNGQILLSGGSTYVFGDVNNNTGDASKGITITGNSSVTFWADVTNTGISQFKVTTGSSATFFGSYGGTGISGGGDLHFEGDLTPGFSPASVTLDNHVVLGPQAVTKIELGGTGPGSQFDQLHITRSLELDGTLQAILINGFLPTGGQSFDILDWGSLIGTFAAIQLPALSAGESWNTSQLYTTGVISVVSTGLPGDFNFNGVVDAADYVVWRKGLGTIYAQSDYNVWRAHFGQSAGGGAGTNTNAAVPEPATWVLCAMALVFVVGGIRQAMRAAACPVVGVLFALALASSAWAADDTWKTAASGNWETGGSWTDGSTPGNSDTATLGQNGTYTVSFGATPAAIQQLSVNNGTNSTFQSSGGAIQTLSINASGGSKTVNLSGGGTTLTLGTSNHTLNLTAGSSLSVQSGSKLQAQFGSDVAASDLSGAGLGGAIVVDGSGSTLTLNNSSAINSVGAGGGTGTLTFQNFSAGNSISGALGVADDAVANSNGTVNITSGSAVSLSGNLTLATQDITGQSALLTINGTNSSLTQSGASSITIGSATNGTAVVQVGIPTSGGTLTTGTGTLTINKTGSLYVGDFTGMFAGTLNANGNITVNGGQFVAGTGFNWASGKTMTIENGSAVTFSSAYTTVANATYNIHDANSSLQTMSSFFALNNGANVNVSAGGAIGATGFNIGLGTAGTLSVDGTNSSVSGSGGTMTWGSNGGTATVTFSNGAAGNFHRTMGLTTTSLAGSASAGTSAHLTVESGATFTTNALSVASAGGATTSATLDVTGSGSAVTVDSMTVGNATTDTAAVNILSGGILTVSGTSGNGTTTLNHTGTITINGGTFNTGGLTNNGGTLIFASGTLGVTGTSGLTIGSTGPLGNDVILFSGKTINVTNATTINGGASLTLNAGSLNSGSVTLNSTSTLGIGLGGTARGSQYGAVTATGNFALAGSLVITLNSFTPSAGQTFDVLDWAPGFVSGTFSNLQLPALSPGLTWNTSQLYTAGIISVGQPGDYNNDNKVDAADYVIWRKGGGSQTDYNTWRPNFGTNARAVGIDVSHFQGSTGISQDAWNQMASEGKAFAFIKATEGLTGPDDAAMANNVARATSAGILDGVYHYAHPENRPTPAGAVSEADHFLNYAGANIGPGHLRPVLDIEGSSSQLTATALTDWVIAFSNEVVAMRGSSAAPIIYTTPFFTNNRFDARIANYDLWIADQSNLNDPQTGNPSASDLGQFTNWSFWQYAVGTAGGISPIDLDVVHGEYKPLSSFVIPSAMSASLAVPEPAAATFALIALTALVLLPRVLVRRAHRSDLRAQ